MRRLCKRKYWGVIIPLAILLSGCIGNDKGCIRVVADLDIGETQEIQLCDGKIIKLSLLDVVEIRDSLRNAIRGASVKVSVDNQIINLSSGNYNLPVSFGKIQIDCPITKGYNLNANRDFWKLKKDARFRLWPKGSSYVQPGTFVYPIKQKWFASMSHMGNEPCYVNGGEDYRNKIIYYHECIDIGGAEGMDEVVSATDGLVISAKGEILDGYEKLSLRRIDARDGVYVMDNRGWFIRYSHLFSTDPDIIPGKKVKAGQRIGLIGKEGSSGGWVHLHFGIFLVDTLTGDWKAEEPYPYVWESYVRQYKPSLIAVARPHHLIRTGQNVMLDGRKSKSFKGDITRYEWTFSDGTTAAGAIQHRLYEKPGEYSEILKVTDSEGNIDYDFTVVLVYDRRNPDKPIPAMQASYHPTLNLKQGDPVTFLVRTFTVDDNDETWNFGDGSPQVKVKSVMKGKDPTKGKFAETVHSFNKPGNYIVGVERIDASGVKASAHLHVVVNK